MHSLEFVIYRTVPEIELEASDHEQSHALRLKLALQTSGRRNLLN